MSTRSMLHVSKRGRSIIFLLIAVISIAALISVLLIAPFSPLRMQTELPPKINSNHYYGSPTLSYSMHCGLPIGSGSYIFAGGLVDYNNNNSKNPFIDRINKTDFSNKNPATVIEPYDDSKTGMHISPSSINDIKQTKDNGYIAVGDALAGNGTQSYFYMQKMNQSLAKVPDWQRVYLLGEGLSVIQTSDSGYAAVGCAYDNNRSEKYYILKTDQYGNEMWNHSVTIGKFTVIKQMTDGIIVVGGYAKYAGNPYMSGCVDAFNITGHNLPADMPLNAVWGFGPHEMDASVNDLYESSAYESSDHSIWTVGAVKQDDTHSSGWLFKVNSSIFTGQTRIGQVPFPNGTKEVFYKFNDNSYNNFTSINATNDGGFIIGGQTGNGSRSNATNSILLLKIDREGNVLWAQNYKLDLLLPYETSSRLASVQPVGDDEYFFAATSYDSNVDFWNDTNGAEWGALLQKQYTPLPDILTPIKPNLAIIFQSLSITSMGGVIVFFLQRHLRSRYEPQTGKGGTQRSPAPSGQGPPASTASTTALKSAAPAKVGEHRDHGTSNEPTMRATESNLDPLQVQLKDHEKDIESLKSQLELKDQLITQQQSEMRFFRQEYSKATETLNKFLLPQQKRSTWNRLRGKSK